METVSQSTISKRARLDAATYSSAETAALFGVGYTTLNEQIKTGTFPVTPLKIGRQYRFPKGIVDRLLGIESEPQDAA